MANNRIYLRCSDCGDEIFLGKRGGNVIAVLTGQPHTYGYYYEEYEDKPLTERLNEFYKNHECCGGKGFDNFELAYEFEREYEGDEE